jgi:predicted nucleotidyltransferase
MPGPVTIDMKKFLPTPYPELNHVLRELVESVQHALSDNFVGAYLQGSFAVGDFDEHSDVDWIIAIREELAAGQVNRLQAMHGRLFRLESRWAQHLEGSYFPVSILRNPANSGVQLWYLDNGANTLIRSDHCNTLVVRSTVREHGVQLAGPGPVSLVDPIPV